MHSGVCAGAKVKRWHSKVTIVPCKHNPASMKLCHAACVCMCVCVCACARVSSHTPTNRLQSGLCTIPQGIKSLSASAGGRAQEGVGDAYECTAVLDTGNAGLAASTDLW